MREKNIDNNFHWIDPLRVLATLSVIFIHASAEILYQFGSISDFDWWVGNIYDSSFRFCVPIFLMITGALIFSKTYESTGEYLRKRVLRIMYPFLFWSIIYIIKAFFDKIHLGVHLNFIAILKFTFYRLKNGAFYHLWYIYLVIGLYLFFPIVAKWIRKSYKDEIKYFLGIWLLTSVFQLPLVDKIEPKINLTYFSGYLGFPILGYYLSNFTLDFGYKKSIYLLMIATGILITIFGTFFITKHQNQFDGSFFGYLTPNVFLVSVGIFLYFKDFVKFGDKTTSVILFFSKFSYGTYLIHVLVLMILAKFGISYAFINPLAGIPITSVLCFIISTLIIFGLNKLPLGKYISG